MADGNSAIAGLRVTGQYRDFDGTARVFRANLFAPGTNNLVGLGGVNTPFRRDQVRADGLNFQKLKLYSVASNFEYDLGPATLTSVTSWWSGKYTSRGDIDGGVHFAAPLRNAQDVSDALATLAADGRGELVAQWGADVLAVFEEVFRHASYTGRSSSFFAYEGVGSVYWHMVSKLLVAVREHLDAALRATPRDAGRVAALRAAYGQVRSGLGFAKSAQEYGAFPHDPYSHTPAGKGARQPGMTGQVKEDVLARWAELGVSYRDGRIAIDASAIAPENWSSAPGVWRMVDLQGHDVALALPADTIGLTVAQTPIVLARGEGAGQVIEARDSAGNLIESARDGALSVPTSSAMMLRTGRVARVDVRW